MIVENKYAVTYFKMMCKAKNENRTKDIQYENHHILPSCLFPEFKRKTETPWNFVLLTHREHFLAHWLLTKMFSEAKETRKMKYAFSWMTTRYKSGWRHEKARLSYGDASRNRQMSETQKQKLSEDKKLWHKHNENPFSGKKHSAELKQRWSDERRGENHVFYGKKRPEHSKTMSMVMSGRKKSQSHKKAISENWQNTRVRVSCEFCSITDITKGMYNRWHGEKCKSKESVF